jgi:hypothetical protein
MKVRCHEEKKTYSIPMLNSIVILIFSFDVKFMRHITGAGSRTHVASKIRAAIDNSNATVLKESQWPPGILRSQA